MKKRTLLVIDDDPNIHSLIDFHLEGIIDVIMHASFASEGLRVAGDKVPDVILLDIGLPDEDGFQLLKKLKADENTRDIPVIFLTAKRNPINISTGLDIGADDYITKPFEGIELQARVRVALRKPSKSE